MTWDPVYTSPADALTAYHVVYKDASGKAYTKKMGSRKSIARLTSLGKFSTYTVTVTAVTDEGLGETSSVITVTTMEDGEFLSFLCVFLRVYKSTLCQEQKIIAAMCPTKKNPFCRSKGKLFPL